MNGRILGEDTPEGRLAAAAHAAILRCVKEAEHKCVFCKNPTFVPDYADLREFVLPFVLLELIDARMKEAYSAIPRSAEEQLQHVRELERALAAIRKRVAELPKTF